MCPDAGELNSGLLEADVRRVGDGSDGEQTVAALHGPSVREGGDHAGLRAGHRFCAGLGEHGHPVALEDVLDHSRGVGVLTGQDLVAGGNQGDLGAERRVCGGELGTGHTGTHNDEVLGHLGEGVELRPGQDALTIRDGRVQDARACAHGDHHGVCVDLIEVGSRGALAGGDDEALGAVQASVALHNANPGLDQLGFHVLRLLAGESHEPGVDGGQVDGDLRSHRPARFGSGEELDAEVCSFADAVGGLGGGDEGFRWHDVGENGRTADPFALDQGHFCTQLRTGQRGFVSARPTSEDRDALRALEFIGHSAIVAE